MHSLMIPCSFALLLLLLLLFADAHSENLIEQVILPVDQPFDNNNNTVTWSLNTIETEIYAAEYTYLMKLRVKTSGDADYIETNATLDTGSDLIWLNAMGCEGDACHCSNENSKSKTTTTTNQQCIEEPERLITCEDEDCKLLESLNIEKECSLEKDGSFCRYGKKYEDGFTTKGKLGTGKFRFRIIDHGDNINSEKPTDFNADFNFGASTISKGRLEPKSHGIVGLGFGELSLLKQNNRILPKFSYCLPNPKSSPNPKRKIKFGNKVDTSDEFSTRLLTKQEGGPVCEYRYCVRLATIATISGNGREEDKITVSKVNNVMVIDSASTFTYLVNGLFNKFFEKVKHVIGDKHKPKEFEPYDNCFEESAVSEEKLKKVSFEFGGVGGSGTTKIELKRENFFDSYTPPDEGKTNYLCLTVVDGDKKKNNHGRLLLEEDFGRENENSNQHILGNRAQMDFLVAFDLSKKDEKLVSFDEKKCSDGENQELSVLSE